MTKSSPVPGRRMLSWRGPPLALQIMALLLGGLVVAQAVTLLLTLFLPPEPPAKYGLADIAAALRDDPAGYRGLQRKVRTAPPMISGRGWLRAPTSRTELARQLGVTPARVVLAFYTPLPFAGTVDAAPMPSSRADTGAGAGLAPANWNRTDPRFEDMAMQPAVFVTTDDTSSAALFTLAQAGPGPGGPGGPPLGGPGAGFPGGGFPGGMPGGGATPPGPPGGAPQAPSAQMPQAPAPPPGAAAPPPAPNQAGTAAPAPTAPAAVPNAAPPPGAAMPATMTAPGGAPQGLPPAPGTAMLPFARADALFPRDAAPVSRVDGLPHSAVVPEAPARSEPARSAPSAASDAMPPFPQAIGNAPARSMAPALAFDQAPAPRVGLQGAIDRARALFGLAPARFVEGDFVAALALPDNHWVVVQPQSGGLLSPWQKRVALWFLVAFGLTAPVGWLFARRLSRPLDRFADAAAQLGRDPSVAIVALDGPAEIGRAAHAFNLMQRRLRSFVDDRTAMVGAISHDLRTPLTRMRFRIEDAPEPLRSGMLEEVDEMEEMITSVLAFIRDASSPGMRERLDLRTLLDDVVEDAAVIGAEVPVTAEGHAATVEVEVTGMRRVLGNLIENALKYGQCARIELTVSQDEAIAAVIDEGPGLPEDELERVFQPFYRTAAARSSGAPGSGLGLAVCRSIARAHGGDVRLCRSTSGFRAELRVPLVYEAARPLAA